MLREVASGKCLRYFGGAGTSGTGKGVAKLTDCMPETDAGLFWHLGNKGGNSLPAQITGRYLGLTAGQCCSGLRAWNTDQCLSYVANGHFQTSVCDVSGESIDQ